MPIEAEEGVKSLQSNEVFNTIVSEVDTDRKYRKTHGEKRGGGDRISTPLAAEVASTQREDAEHPVSSREQTSSFFTSMAEVNKGPMVQFNNPFRSGIRLIGRTNNKSSGNFSFVRRRSQDAVKRNQIIGESKSSKRMF